MKGEDYVLLRGEKTGLVTFVAICPLFVFFACLSEFFCTGAPCNLHVIKTTRIMHTYNIDKISLRDV